MAGSGDVEGRPSAAVTVSTSGDGAPPARVELTGERVTIGRLAELNDIVLGPDPQHLVSRTGHCVLERTGEQWFVRDGGSLNGTYLRRGAELRRLADRTALRDGDVVCVLAEVAESGERRFFELAFEAAADPQATRPARVQDTRSHEAPCLRYDARSAELVLVEGREEHRIPLRAQTHRLLRYMAERNQATGESSALCTHEELMHAVWADEPMHSRTELAKLVWEIRKQLEPFGAADLIENERRLGYRLRTCR
jgi:DNA-binding response OmpR family regulator